MLNFKRFQAGLYLTEADYGNPSGARVGFLFQDASRTDAGFELNAASWADAGAQGYFCFFTPSANCPWPAFAANVRQAFVTNPGSQFAFFTEDDKGNVNAVAMLLVQGQGSSSPTLSATASFVSRNATLQITPFPFYQPPVAWDDANNQFTIGNSGPTASVQLTFQPADGGSALVSPAVSSQLLLPMTGNAAGTVNSAFRFALSDLDLLEAGLMYFAPPQSSGGLLTVLRIRCCAARADRLIPSTSVSGSMCSMRSILAARTFRPQTQRSARIWPRPTARAWR